MKYFLYFLVLFFFGCSNSIEPQYSKRSYDGIQKDQVLHAAKKVFKFSDREEFFIDSYRNDLNVSRLKASYYMIGLDNRLDKFHVHVEENNSSTDVQLSIYRIDDEENNEVENIDINSSVYALFWDRMEYFLGLKPNWTSCSMHYALLNFDGFLCDVVDVTNVHPNRWDVIDLNATRVTRPKMPEKIMIDSNRTNSMHSRKDAFDKSAQLSSGVENKTTPKTESEKRSDQSIEEDIKDLNDIVKMNGYRVDSVESQRIYNRMTLIKDKNVTKKIRVKEKNKDEVNN